MFRSKTVFVVGAGGSVEAGLPTGAGLKDIIAGKLAIRFRHGQDQISGSHDIMNSLRRRVRGPNGRGDAEPYRQAAMTIAQAMPQALSIDNYIDAHRDDKIELCGKLGIVQSILEAEAKSMLFFNDIRENTIKFSNLGGTWYTSFMQLLTESLSKADLAKVFENISFVTFNYDRCIEHFLFHSLRNYYVISESNAKDLMRSLIIKHPYGTVGSLPWQTDDVGVPFGGADHGVDLLALASQIKTFTERTDDEEALKSLHALFEDADCIVFLGFAFHPQNMQLMTSGKPSKAKRVFATGKGISDTDCEMVAMQIRDMLYAHPRDIKIDIRNDLTCTGLFAEFWRSLALL